MKVFSETEIAANATIAILTRAISQKKSIYIQPFYCQFILKKTLLYLGMNSNHRMILLTNIMKS
jgi:hypothetical protein